MNFVFFSLFFSAGIDWNKWSVGPILIFPEFFRFSLIEVEIILLINIFRSQKEMRKVFRMMVRPIRNEFLKLVWAF